MYVCCCMYDKFKILERFCNEIIDSFIPLRIVEYITHYLIDDMGSCFNNYATYTQPTDNFVL